MRRDTLLLVLIALTILVLLWLGLDADAREDLRGLGALIAEATRQVWHSWFG